jgi:RsiW-degrading membrane proteinase PrsW (M82 family)
MLLDTLIILTTKPISNLLAAFFGGLLPVLVWLWFLEREDKNPEPKRLIIMTFIAGMAGVLVVIPIESLVVQSNTSIGLTIILWAIIEETIKFIAAGSVALWRSENDEPIDSMMYMVAAALGFAALENAFFILGPILQGNAVQAIITGNFRFIGATLLHVVTSAIIGSSLALGFYKNKTAKGVYALAGFILAVVLHTSFNLLIILDNGSRAVFAFYIIWIALVGTLLFFEKVKKLEIVNK